MKKYIALLLALVMVLTLTACGLSTKDLAHKWVMMDNYTEDGARENLEAFGFYEEEIALADLTCIGAVRYLTFGTDGSYSFIYNEEETHEKLVAYYDNYITNLFNNRDKLVDDYGADVIDELSDEETFKEFYAYMFSCETYEALLDALADDTFDFSEANEQGTYKLTGDTVILYENGGSDGATIGVALEGNTLTITYTDGTEVYTLAD